jgi:hypothetical protein
MWYERCPPFCILSPAGDTQFLVFLPLQLCKKRCGGLHSGLNDLSRHLNCRGEPVKSDLTFCAGDMTIAQSVHTASRLCWVSISQTQTKRCTVKSKLLHPGFNESGQGCAGGHCASSTDSAKAGASATFADSIGRIPLLWKPPCRGRQVGESASSRLDELKVCAKSQPRSIAGYASCDPRM